MWPTRRERRTVACIACGTSVARDDAREYDKHGDRWDREGKTFEYLCKPCFRELSNASRDGLEDRLIAVGAGTTDRETFLDRYLSAGEEGDTGGSDRGRNRGR